MPGDGLTGPTFSYPPDLGQIQDIQDSLAECLGITLFVTNPAGDFITRPSGHAPICLLTSSPPQHCQVARMAIEAGLAERPEKAFYVSCGGRQHVLVPIKLGNLLGGLMVAADARSSFSQQAINTADLDLKLLPPAELALGPLDQHQSVAVGNLLHSIANRLVDLDVRHRSADWRMRELAVINEASVAMISTLDLQALPDIVVKKAAELSHADVAFLVMPDERTGDLRLAASSGLPEAAKRYMRVRPGEGLIGMAALTGKPVLENDAVLPTFNGGAEDSPTPQRASMICIPLKADGTMVGVLGVWRSGGSYGQESLQTIQSLVTHATFAILNARLYEEAQQSLQKLNRLFELGTEINSVQSLDEVLKEINRHALEATHGMACNITLIDDDGRVRIRSAIGFPPRINKRIIVRPEGLSMRVKRSGQPLAIPDTLTSAEGVNPVIVQAGVRSSLCLPLQTKDRNIGVMWVHYSEPRTFPHADVDLLLAFANQAAVAIDNAQLREELVQQATRDGKTSLFNYDFFLAQLRAEMDRAKRADTPLSLIMIDIDSFKAYNDTFGHLAGDDALRMVANLILGKTRKTDVVARYGGEEFTVLLPNTDAEVARYIAERIRSAIEAASQGIGQSSGQPRLTVSLGIASFPHHASTDNELMERADKALYRAKAIGKNKVSVFSP